MSDEPAKSRWVILNWRFWCCLSVLSVSIVVVLLIVVVESSQHLPRINASASKMRLILLAMQSYSIDHDGQWPDSFERIDSEYLLVSDSREHDYFVNPRDGYLTYRLISPTPVVEDSEDPSELSVLYEVKNDGTIDLNGCIGYADGHVEGPADRPGY